MSSPSQATRYQQLRLKALGYYSGAIDGLCGPKTRSAIADFGKYAGISEGSGQELNRALGIDTILLEKVTPEIVHQMSPATPKANIVKNLPYILDALAGEGLGDKPMILCALATVRAETEGFLPISEGKSHFNTLHSPFDRYDDRKDLGNTGSPDGSRYRGRGFVQLTGRANYTNIGHLIGVPLEENPDLANDPEVAAKILAKFMRVNIRSLRAALAIGNLVKARRVVNGGSHGIDHFESTYRAGEKLI